MFIFYALPYHEKDQGNSRFNSQIINCHKLMLLLTMNKNDKSSIKKKNERPTTHPPVHGVISREGVDIAS
mgnify:CR=1 FL=1